MLSLPGFPIFKVAIEILARLRFNSNLFLVLPSKLHSFVQAVLASWLLGKSTTGRSAFSLNFPVFEKQGQRILMNLNGSSLKSPFRWRPFLHSTSEILSDLHRLFKDTNI